MKRNFKQLNRALALAAAVGMTGAYAHTLPETNGYEARAQTGVDGPLARSVAAALERAPAMAGAQIQVVVEGSVAHLRGSVESEEQRRVAHEVAHSVPGIRDVVVSDLRYGAAPPNRDYGMQSDDRVLHEEVHDALHRTRGIDTSDLTVEVRGGVVYLHGSVPNHSQKDYAHDIAHSVPGVRDVDAQRLMVSG